MFVPQSYVYLRGQGVRIFSLVSRCCNLKQPAIRMPTLKRPFHIHDYVNILIQRDMNGREKTQQLIMDDSN